MHKRGCRVNGEPPASAGGCGRVSGVAVNVRCGGVDQLLLMPTYRKLAHSIEPVFGNIKAEDDPGAQAAAAARRGRAQREKEN